MQSILISVVRSATEAQSAVVVTSSAQGHALYTSVTWNLYCALFISGVKQYTDIKNLCTIGTTFRL